MPSTPAYVRPPPRQNVLFGRLELLPLIFTGDRLWPSTTSHQPHRLDRDRARRRACSRLWFQGRAPDGLCWGNGVVGTGPEVGREFLKGFGFLGETMARGGGLLHHCSVLLGDLVHLVHRGVHLGQADGLFLGACRDVPDHAADLHDLGYECAPRPPPSR